MPKSQQSKPQSSHQLYDVEKILDKKILENKVKYLVKWVGYDLEECNFNFYTFYLIIL